ncbi:MAG: hypothetical protein LBV12_02960 [Puniceicoccales bacterium]|jgi:hypothetical protein|nr:hypothetical protein [Puniceicoccales bacterium]
MKLFKPFTLTVAGTLMATSSLTAAVLADWTFTNMTWYDGSTSPIPITNNLIASSSLASSDFNFLAIGNLVSTGPLKWSVGTPSGSTGNDFASSISLASWDNSDFRFTINVGVGSSLTIDSIFNSVYRNGSGAYDTGTWSYSVDNGGVFTAIASADLGLAGGNGTGSDPISRYIQ